MLRHCDAIKAGDEDVEVSCEAIRAAGFIIDLSSAHLKTIFTVLILAHSTLRLSPSSPSELRPPGRLSLSPLTYVAFSTEVRSGLADLLWRRQSGQTYVTRGRSGQMVSGVRGRCAG